MRFISYVILAMLFASPCWSHPGTLDEYPERFPGKTLQAIADEWEPRPADALSAGALSEATLALADQWGEKTAAELKQQIETLMEQNRRGEYRKRIANGLYDLQDLLTHAEAARPEEALDYVTWRLARLNDDDGFFEELPSGSWDETRSQTDARTREWNRERDKEVSGISIKAETAAPALRPHWLVQCGALEFRHRRYAQATGYFQRVIEAFPQHPRAEIALLMMARVQLDQWKQFRMPVDHDLRKERELLNETRRSFELYKARYPEGRFMADIIGWEAGISRINGSVSDALKTFLIQAGQPGHPEIRRRAFQQIEWLLKDLAAKTWELASLPWNEIAAEPVVALRIGYFMLDAESETDLGALMFRRDGEDHRVLESLAPTLHAVRTAARPAWRHLDQALARQQQRYQGKPAVIREVLHAWSAVVRGEPSLALELVGEPTSGTGADDALLVKAIAQVKAEQDAAAIRTFDELDHQCQESALRRGSDLRRCDAWLHLNQPSTAIPLLWSMLEGKGLANYRQDMEMSPPLHLPGEIQQRLSAVLTFAPLASLVQTASGPDLPPGLRTILRNTLRIRYLASEQFAESLLYAGDADFESWNAAHERSNERERSPAIVWRDDITALQQLTATVARTDQKQAKAAAWIALGNAWEKGLWRWLPGGFVHVQQGFAYAQLPEPSFPLRQHARLLGISETAAIAALDQRQEITHALRCYEAALNLSAQGSAEALTAILAIQAALRTRAEVSPYFMDRAVETHDAVRSKELHDRIKTEYPATEAARNMAWWTFRPSSTLGQWHPGISGLFRYEIELATLLTSGAETNYWEEGWSTEQSLKRLSERLKQVFPGEQDSVKLQRELASLRRSVRMEAPTAKASPLLNHLDDLELLLQVPNLSVEARIAYFQTRMDGKPVEIENAVFASIKDFATFWNFVITPSTTALTETETKLQTEQPQRSSRQRVAQAQVARMTKFLEQFPQSPKREAALARLAINTLRQSRSHCGMVWVDAVATASTAYAVFGIERGLPFDLKAVTEALDHYDREFPDGRYHWDLRLIRGIAASENHDWGVAITHLLAVLNQPNQSSLHLDASNNLAEIFMQLLTPAHRADILKAIKTTPGAADKLDRFMHSPTCGWQLRILRDWLQASLRA